GATIHNNPPPGIPFLPANLLRPYRAGVQPHPKPVRSRCRRFPDNPTLTPKPIPRPIRNASGPGGRRPSPLSPPPPHPAPDTRRRSHRPCFLPPRSTVWHPPGDRRNLSRGRRWRGPFAVPSASSPPSPGRSPGSLSHPSPPAGNAFGQLSKGRGITGRRKDVDVGKRRLHPLRLRPIIPVGKERIQPDHPGGSPAELGHRTGQPVRLPAVQAVARNDHQAVPTQHPSPFPLQKMLQGFPDSRAPAPLQSQPRQRRQPSLPVPAKLIGDAANTG